MFQDEKLISIYLTNVKCTSKQMKNEWAETGSVNVCDRSVRNELNEMELTSKTPNKTRTDS